MHHVGQLVRQETPAARAAGIVFSATEEHVSPRRERAGVERAIQAIRLRTGVNPDPTEIGVECLSHLALNSAIQRLSTTARALDGALHGRGRDIRFPFCLSRDSEHPLHVPIAILPL